MECGEANTFEYIPDDILADEKYNGIYISIYIYVSLHSDGYMYVYILAYIYIHIQMYAVCIYMYPCMNKHVARYIYT